MTTTASLSTIRTTTVRTECGVSVSAETIDGVTYVSADTPCCGAAATGTCDGFRCKECYKPVPSYCAEAGWQSIYDACVAAGCPCPDECADNTLWHLGA